MTWGGGYGSHSETATAAPSRTWFLAEGATHGAFQLFYLLQNPAATPAHVSVTYLLPAPAAPITLPYTIAAESRLTIPVDNIHGLAATDVSASIVSDVAILVERAMYMDTANPPQVFGAGHAGSGVIAANPRWFLAEGATGGFFDMYYLIANPSTQATTVRVTYLLPNGAPLEKDYAVAAQSRLTIFVDDQDPRLTDTPVSAIIESLNGVGIVVERSMWWPGFPWTEGHLSAGSTTTARRWAVAGGVIGAGVETYVLIANTSNIAGNATVTALRSHDGGPVASQVVPLPAEQPRERADEPATRTRRAGRHELRRADRERRARDRDRARHLHGLRRHRLGRRPRLAGNAAAVTPRAQCQLPTPNFQLPMAPGRRQFGSWELEVGG